ncbi:MAG: cytidylate kinase family protein, partial [Lachnospiraceae bacterium]|nr:cytidylate kinase family protein [Lachnospiraceae bacterium]
ERLTSLEESLGTDSKKLETQIRAIDKKRKEYYQYYSGNEWGKPKNYDLCLNSGTLGIDTCVDLIAALVTL